MHTEFAAQIRAHAHALVRMARTLPDHKAAELESLALALLKDVHAFEVGYRRLSLTESALNSNIKSSLNGEKR
jgi:hypothetical protein